MIRSQKMPLQREKTDRETLSCLTKDFSDFLRGDTSGKMYNYLFQDLPGTPIGTAMESWNKALAPSSLYYLFRNESELITKNAGEIAKCLQYQPTVIELGIGSKDSIDKKTIPLLESFKPQRAIINDFSSDTLLQARQQISTALPSLKVDICAANFIAQADQISLQGPATVITIGTVTNITSYNGQMPVNEVVEFLRAMRCIAGENGNLIITQDTNHDKGSLSAAYGCREVSSFRQNFMQRAKYSLKLNALDLTGFKDEMIWEPSCGRLASTFLCTKDQTVEIDGEAIHIPAGRRLYLANSYKYPAQDFLHMARIAGLEPVRTFMDAQDRVALHVLRPTS